MRVCFCHGNDSTLLREAIEAFVKKYPELTFEGHNEDTPRGRRKSFAIKSRFAARLTPFCGLMDKDEIRKGFYSEARECTEENIKKYISRHFSEEAEDVILT